MNAPVKRRVNGFTARGQSAKWTGTGSNFPALPPN